MDVLGFLHSRSPGPIMLFGSVFVWGLIGVALRAMGLPDPAAMVLIGLGGAITVLVLDVRYRMRKNIGPFDLRTSTIFFLPTWMWSGVILFVILPAALRADSTPLDEIPEQTRTEHRAPAD